MTISPNAPLRSAIISPVPGERPHAFRWYDRILSPVTEPSAQFGPTSVRRSTISVL